MSFPAWFRVSSAGFTLIEVIAALVIFSVGVLMVLQVSGALGTQMRYAGASSEIAVVAQARLDSLESIPLASLTPGTTVDTLVAEGIEYECTLTVTSITAALSRIEIGLAPIDGGGPSHSMTSYSSAPW